MLQRWTGRHRTTVPARPGPDHADGPPAPVTPARRRLGRTGAALGLVAIVAAALAPSVSAAQTVTLTSQFVAVAVAPGSGASFPVVVNVTEAGRVDLAVTGAPEDWTVALRGGGFVVDGVEAGPDAPTTVTLDVNVPPTASEGTTTLTVTGAGGGSTDELDIDLRVTTTAAGDLTLTSDAPSLRGTADVTFNFTLTLRNDTAEDLTFAALAQGPTGWDVTATLAGQAQAASAVIESGSTATITVAAKPPTDVPAGAYPIAVRVTAGNQVVDAQLQAEVTGTTGMAFTTENERLDVSGTAGSAIPVTFSIQNTGTTTLEAIQLSSNTPTGWTVEFDPDAIPSIAAGQTTQVNATINPSDDAVAGDYQVTVTAQNAGVNQQLEIRAAIEASPIGGIIALVILAVVVIGLVLVFRRYGRR